MRINFNDFKKVYHAKQTSIDAAIKRVLESGRFVLGEEVKKFEQDFSTYIGTRHAIGVANGLEALQIALMALELKPDEEVITTSLSAVATSLAITHAGGKPIFVDIDNFYHIDADKIEAAITSKTRAILPVHLYGQSAAIDKIAEIAKKHEIVVIEDCAQAHGATLRNQKVGTFGIAGCFSFYPTKNLGAFGDGGAIVTNDEIFADKCRMIRNYGQINRYEHTILGINSRLDELQAAILSELLPDIQQKNQRRAEIAALFRQELSGINQIKLPEEREGTGHVYHLFVIETEKREELKLYLDKSGIDSLIHYPIPIHKQKCYQTYNDLSLPLTEDKVTKILSLPIHPYLTDSEVRYICDHIKLFIQN